MTSVASLPLLPARDPLDFVTGVPKGMLLHGQVSLLLNVLIIDLIYWKASMLYCFFLYSILLKGQRCFCFNKITSFTFPKVSILNSSLDTLKTFIGEQVSDFLNFNTFLSSCLLGKFQVGLFTYFICTYYIYGVYKQVTTGMLPFNYFYILNVLICRIGHKPSWYLI